MLHFNKLNKMTKSINKQVEAQGAKKFDSFKGFQELNSKELRKVEGGGFGPFYWGLLRFNWVRLSPDYPKDNFV